MARLQPRPLEADLLESVWDPKASQRCVVCRRPSGGKAICGDKRCAAELANG
ncbi:MAG TPA: hypothetical protein VGK74_09525 [Symbiobacteriaceae bacterium]|jgi:hypothetical protein